MHSALNAHLGGYGNVKTAYDMPTWSGRSIRYTRVGICILRWVLLMPYILAVSLACGEG